jgi:hypothetical protein
VKADQEDEVAVDPNNIVLDALVVMSVHVIPSPCLRDDAQHVSGRYSLSRLRVRVEVVVSFVGC